jgi:hypothetical protein
VFVFGFWVCVRAWVGGCVGACVRFVLRGLGRSLGSVSKDSGKGGGG